MSGSLSEELWRGAVPAVITLAKNEIVSASVPEDIYLMLPRMSYLAPLLEPCETYFRDYVAFIDKRDADNLWFESDNLPLKSSLPVGVLFDCRIGGSSLPWKITVHFKGFPTGLMVKSGSPALMQKRYFHSLKQALFLLYGTARLFASLSLHGRADLWDAVCQANCVLFNSVSNALFPAEERGPLEYIPVRCVFLSPSTGAFNVVQKPIGLYVDEGNGAISSVKSEKLSGKLPTERPNGTDTNEKPSGSESNVNEVPATAEEATRVDVQKNTNEAIDISQGESSLQAEELRLDDLDIEMSNKMKNVTIRTPTTVRDVLKLSYCSEPSENCVIKVQGVEVTEETPLFELWSLFAHALLLPSSIDE